MNQDRRSFLVSAGALAAVAACDEPVKGPPPPHPEAIPAPDRAVEPEPFAPAEAMDEVAFAWGVQVGDATAGGALVALRTTAVTVDLVLLRASGEGWEEVDRQTGLPVVEGNVAVELSGLDADTAYTVHFVDGDRSSPTARFRTALAADGFRKVVFAATSCLGSINPGWASIARVAEADPDFALLLGDTVYADGSLTIEDYRAHWELALANPSLRALFARTSVISTWDDHEVANNWRFTEADSFHDNVTPEQVATATLAFREALPMRVGPGGSGLWRKLSWGVVDLFVLDCRGERSVGKIVSDDQLDWITSELAASPAQFKIVLASVHVTDHYDLLSSVAADDRWQGYPAQRDAFVAAIAAVPGVFVVTGDMHYGAAQRIDPEGGAGAEQWEIAAGPAGSTLFDVEAVAGIGGGTLPAQYEVLIDTWSSCLFVADPGLGTLTVQFVGDDGAVLAEKIWTVV